MTLTRRNFLKGLLAAGAAALVPQALVEKVHGASDLTPRERDAMANALGLGSKHWAGWQPYRYVTIDDGPRHLLESFDLSSPEPLFEYGAEWSYTTYRRGWRGDVSVGLGDSALLADVLNSEVHNPTARMKIVIGGQTICDENVRIHSYSIIDDLVSVGISQAHPSPDHIVTMHNSGAQIVDNLGLTIDVGYVSYMAALSKGKLADSLTESEKRQAFMNEVLREEHA